MPQPADLFWLTFWIALPVLLLAQGSIIVTALRSRGRPASRQVGMERWRGNARLDMLWAVVPGLLVVALAAMTYHVLQAGR